MGLTEEKLGLVSVPIIYKHNVEAIAYLGMVSNLFIVFCIAVLNSRFCNFATYSETVQRYLLV